MEVHAHDFKYFQSNDVSVTKVTITDKDCSEIAALEEFFPNAEHILCQFHALKAVDARLNKKFGDKALKQPIKDGIRDHFRSAMYAENERDFENAKSGLLKQGT